MPETLELFGVVGWDIDPGNVRRQLKALGDVDEIDVFVDSPGGFVDDGFSIYTSLKNHPARINIHIVNEASSMMSVIAMAGDSITMEETGIIMIHPPSGMIAGTASDLRKEAEVLDKYAARLKKAYQSRDVNMSDDELSEAIEAETWYTADEALEAGFIDAIKSKVKGTEDGAESSGFYAMWAKIAQYKNSPSSVKERIKKAANRQAKKPSGSAVENNKGNDMTDKKGVSEADIDAKIKAEVDAAVQSNDQKWQNILAHKNAKNTAAALKIGKMNLSPDQANEMMDLVALPEDSINKIDGKDDKNSDPEASKQPTIKEMFEQFMANSEVNMVNKNASKGDTGNDNEMPNRQSAEDLYNSIKG